jgi:hypothetical protein
MIANPAINTTKAATIPAIKYQNVIGNSLITTPIDNDFSPLLFSVSRSALRNNRPQSYARFSCEIRCRKSSCSPGIFRI